MNQATTIHEELADLDLVRQSQAGDARAFAEIVNRYQTLLCSIAFGITGNLATSEDLAQDAFVAAWMSLSTLREAEKLRPWLCGTVRNLAHNHHRRQQRDALTTATVLSPEAVPRREVPDRNGPTPEQAMISDEDVSLLNQSLAELPPTYREPLILYYRQQQSVTAVAEQLDLNPNTVKQRLARGRALLRAELTAIVERGLQQSAPRRAFTLAVMSALPLMSTSAQAAATTATAAKGASGMKAAAWIGGLGAVVGPLVGILAAYLGFQLSLRSARSEQERALVRRFARGLIALILLFGVALTGVILGHQSMSPRGLALAITAVSLGYVAALVGLIVTTQRAARRVRCEADTTLAACESSAAILPAWLRPFQEERAYVSQWRLLGIPLVCIRFRGQQGVGAKRVAPAVGWIAIGDMAWGVLFGCGGVASGCIAFGGASIGVLSFGGAALGLFVMAGLSLGGWAQGGIAAGWLAKGGLAFGWQAAAGGIATSHQYAVGGVANAPEANSAAAQTFIAASPFFQWSDTINSPWAWWAMVGLVLTTLIVATKYAQPVTHH